MVFSSLAATCLCTERPEAIAEKGIAFLEAGRFEEAEQQFARALRANPNLIEAQNLMGVALDQQGKHSEARAYFLKAIRLRSDYAPAHANLGLNAVQSGEFKLAAAEFRKSLTIDPIRKTPAIGVTTLHSRCIVRANSNKVCRRYARFGSRLTMPATSRSWDLIIASWTTTRKLSRIWRKQWISIQATPIFSMIYQSR